MEQNQNSSRNNRLRFALVLTAVAGACWFAATVHSSGLKRRNNSKPASVRAVSKATSATAEASETSFIRQFPLITKDLIYNPTTQRIYASLPSTSQLPGNSILPIEPIAGTFENSVFIGSEPGKLALSGDGQTLYVGLDGAGAVRRLDIPTLTAGSQFSLGSEPYPFGLRSVNDLEVQPGNPNVVLVSRRSPGQSSSQGDVAVYENGIQRPGTTSEVTRSSVEFGASPEVAHALTAAFDNLLKLRVDTNGLTVLSSTTLSQTSTEIEFDNGKLYINDGKVIDPDSGSLLGSFSWSSQPGTSVVRPDSAVGRVYFLTRTFSETGSVLRAFDKNTFAQIGTLNLPELNETPTSLIRWGSNGLAFRTDSKLYLIQTSLIPSADPIPTPTPTPSPTPSPSASPSPALFVRQISLPTKDLVVIPSSQMIYASVPSEAGQIGNSLTRVDPGTGIVGPSVYIGSEPGKMALSDDGHTLYTGLDGAGAVRRFDIATQTAGQQFSLGFVPRDGLRTVKDLAVQPGNPNVVVVARNVGESFQPNGDVAAYENGVQRPNTTAARTKSFVEFGNGPNTVHAMSGTNGLLNLNLDVAGLTLSSTSYATLSEVDITFENGRLYAANGAVIDSASGNLVGTLSSPDWLGQALVRPDSATSRVYVLTNIGSGGPMTLRAFDPNTFMQIASVPLVVSGTPTSLIRWGSNGLAFRTASRVYLIQTSLIPSGDPIPTPTPTPSPSPSPSPTPALFVRQISLPTKDLVVIPASQQIYASVISQAGAIGNSLTRIDPLTGNLVSSSFIGSEPGKLALSDDGRTIYASLDGAAAVRRFDANTQTAGLQFNIGNTGTWPNTLEDLVVMPGHPSTVAMAAGNFNGARPGVAVFDDGVRRDAVGPSFPRSNVVEFGATASVLYGLNTFDSGEDLNFMSVTPAGVSQIDNIPGLLIGNDFSFSNGLLYTTFGNVFDPGTKSMVGSFPNAQLIAPDPGTGRIYVLGGGLGNPFFLKALDIQTLLPLGSVPLSGITTTPSSLVRWGANGLAFRDTDHVFLIQTSLVPSAEPVPTGSPTPSPTPTPTPVPTPDDLKIVSLATNDLVYDANTQKFFASVPSTAGANGNSITSIDSNSGAIGASVPIGTEPGKLVISDDGQFLYSVLNQTAIRRFIVATQTPSLSINLGAHPTNGPYLATDLAVLPGNPHAFAVARKFSSSFSPKHGGVAIFDDDVQRPFTTPATDSDSDGIEFSSSSQVLYGYESTDSFSSNLRKMAVSSCGVVVHNLAAPIGSFDSGFRYENGLVFSNRGRMIDPDTGFPKGTFAKTGQQVVADSKSGRAYVLDSFAMTIYAVDLRTFLQVGAVRIPGASGTVSSLQRWGSDGLAFRTNANQVVILRAASLFPNAPIPVVSPPATPTFTAVGRVTDSVTHDPVSGVIMSLSGAQTATTQTDANGNYSFPNLDQCSSYNITPAKDPLSFNPAVKTFVPAGQSSFENGKQTHDFVAVAPGLQFFASSFSITEGTAGINITVTRGGDNSAPVSVNYSTADGTAKQSSDYMLASGTLNFASGESSKTFAVLIVDDVYVEGDQTVLLSLSNPAGAILGPVSTATLTIRDNDFQPSGINPIDNPQVFVFQHYYDFLNRVPDQSGFAFWVGQITQCGNNQECIRTKRIDVSNAFFYELEYQQTGAYVYRLYRAAFGNDQPFPNPHPDANYPGEDKKQPGYAVFAPDRARVRGGPSLAQTQLDLANAFVERPAFLTRYPASLDGPAFVDAVLANIRNDIGPDLASQRDALIGLFNQGGRGAVMYRLADDNAQTNPINNRAFIDAEYNRTFVATQYFGYLRRNPDVAGFIFWLGQVNSAPLRDVSKQHAMVCSFITSAEYQQRFSPVVTHSNAECQ